MRNRHNGTLTDDIVIADIFQYGCFHYGPEWWSRENDEILAKMIDNHLIVVRSDVQPETLHLNGSYEYVATTNAILAKDKINV